jgi:predicted amidohydrolase
MKLVGRREVLTIMAGSVTAAATEPQGAEGKAPGHPGVRLALAQLALEDGDLARNMGLAEEAAREAAIHKPDVLCLPEAADFGWLHQEARRDALTVPGKYTEFLAGLAVRRGVWVCAGCLERDGERVYNSAVIIDRTGRIVLKHRKIRTLPDLTKHLYDAGTPDGTMTVDTEFGRIGWTICADNFDIAIPQRAASAGAWLLLTPHGFAAPVEEMENNARSFQEHIRGIAAKTGMWVAGTNVALARVKGGAWKNQMHCGCSTVARPDGTGALVGKFKQADLLVYDVPEA